MNGLKNLLLNYNCDFPYQLNIRDEMLNFLSSAHPFSREQKQGHFTSSALLLNSDSSKFFLLHHKKLNKWLQPGGHADGEEDLLKVAIKESEEESGILGIVALQDYIFDLDIHKIPSSHREDEHFHYDVRFLLKAPYDEINPNFESFSASWFDIDIIKKLPLEISLMRMINKFTRLKTR